MQFQITEVTGSRKVVISTKNLKELKEKGKAFVLPGCTKTYFVLTSVMCNNAKVLKVLHCSFLI